MDQYTIEEAREEDIEKLAAIERAAAARFPNSVISPFLRESVVPRKQLQEARREGRLWVAVSPQLRPVGFIIATQEVDAAFIQEVDVHPEHQCKGIGRALITRVRCWAMARGMSRVTLTTFSRVSWNAPFYERLGFKAIEKNRMTEFILGKLAEEERLGLRGRVAMELKVDH